jgi:hypothetical protein
MVYHYYASSYMRLGHHPGIRLSCEVRPCHLSATRLQQSATPHSQLRNEGRAVLPIGADLPRRQDARRGRTARLAFAGAATGGA